MTERTAASASLSVVATGVRTQVRPSKRSARAPATPSSSLPAIGWPPLKRGSTMSGTRPDFTLPASVTSPPVSCSERSTSAAMAPTGVATKVISTSCSAPSGAISSMTPVSMAVARVRSSGSRPSTNQPSARSASAIDPPMSPMPTTRARRSRPAAIVSSEEVMVTPEGRRGVRRHPRGTHVEARRGSAWC